MSQFGLQAEHAVKFGREIQIQSKQWMRSDSGRKCQRDTVRIRGVWSLSIELWQETESNDTFGMWWFGRNDAIHVWKILRILNLAAPSYSSVIAAHDGIPIWPLERILFSKLVRASDVWTILSLSRCKTIRRFPWESTEVRHRHCLNLRTETILFQPRLLFPDVWTTPIRTSASCWLLSGLYERKSTAADNFRIGPDCLCHRC